MGLVDRSSDSTAESAEQDKTARKYKLIVLNIFCKINA